MRPLDIAWTLLKALPEQREMADSGQITPSPYMGPEQYEDVDMGTIHPGALSAMSRLQGEGKLDTRSYDPNDFVHAPPGLLMGTQHDRAVSRTGTPRPDTLFYNPETQRMERYDGSNPNSGNVRTDDYRESITPI